MNQVPGRDSANGNWVIYSHISYAIGISFQFFVIAFLLMRCGANDANYIIAICILMDCHRRRHRHRYRAHCTLCSSLCRCVQAPYVWECVQACERMCVCALSLVAYAMSFGLFSNCTHRLVASRFRSCILFFILFLGNCALSFPHPSTQQQTVFPPTFLSNAF